MKAIGIVAEFNPFHEGHAYLIEEIKNNFPEHVIVSVMSGNWMQRGDFAFQDKWSRGRKAVENGVDLVVQLPTRYSNNSSYFFSKGAVDILKQLSVDKIAFGSESGNIFELEKIAQALIVHEYKLNEYAAQSMRNGVSYPKARENFLKDFYPMMDMSMLKNPNNILAIDYMIAAKQLSYQGGFFTVKRRGDGHNLSASKIRKSFYDKNPDMLSKIQRNIFQLLQYKVFSGNNKNEDISKTDLVLRIEKELRASSNISELISKVNTKVYTKSRVRREIIGYIMGISSNMKSKDTLINGIIPIAFNKEGTTYLKTIKNNDDIELINRISRNTKEYSKNSLKIIEEEIRATDIYNMILDNDLYSESDYVKRPVKVEK